MGKDKSLLDYHGKPQREFLFDLLRGVANEVFTSCRQEQDVPSCLNPLHDSFSIEGPLNGILSAFAFRPTRSWLIVAVDMPYVDEDSLRRLIQNRDRTKMATCFYNPQTQQPEPLLTLWETSAHPLLLRFAQSGKKSPREFLRTHPVAMIQPPDNKVLLNFNYPPAL